LKSNFKVFISACLNHFQKKQIHSLKALIILQPCIKLETFHIVTWHVFPDFTMFLSHQSWWIFLAINGGMTDVQKNISAHLLACPKRHGFLIMCTAMKMLGSIFCKKIVSKYLIISICKCASKVLLYHSETCEATL